MEAKNRPSPVAAKKFNSNSKTMNRMVRLYILILKQCITCSVYLLLHR